jgi:hypothetical protein
MLTFISGLFELNIGFGFGFGLDHIVWTPGKLKHISSVVFVWLSSAVVLSFERYVNRMPPRV